MPVPPAAAEQPESARLEVSESSTSLTGESHSDTTDADASVLDPTFTSCLGYHQEELLGHTAHDPALVDGQPGNGECHDRSGAGPAPATESVGPNRLICSRAVGLRTASSSDG
jgi:hypothetical protein